MSTSSPTHREAFISIYINMGIQKTKGESVWDILNHNPMLFRTEAVIMVRWLLSLTLAPFNVSLVYSQRTFCPFILSCLYYRTFCNKLLFRPRFLRHDEGKGQIQNEFLHIWALGKLIDVICITDKINCYLFYLFFWLIRRQVQYFLYHRC